MMGNRRALAQDIGATGLQTSWGMMHDDFLTDWQGAAKVKTITEMVKNSSVIGGALRLAFELAILDIDWQLVSEDGEDDPRIELYDMAIDNMTHSWRDHLQEALLMPFYGWSLFTNTYERVGANILWRKFKMLGHDTIQQWLMADDGGLAGVQQWPHLWPTPIPIERCLLYRFRKTQNNPEGESILRPSWLNWYYVKNIQQVEAIGIERRVAGMPMIMPPQDADMAEGSTDFTLAQTIVRNVRMDEQMGVVLPPPNGPEPHEQWRFELLTAAGGNQVMDTDTVIKRHESRMLQSALAQFLMLGQDSVGALATFKGGNDFFTMALNSLADNIAETFTKYAVSRLMRLNGYEPDGLRLTHSPAGDIGIEVIGQFLQQVDGMLTWTPDDEVWLRSFARMPEKSTEELEQQQQEEADRKATIAAQFVPQPPNRLDIFKTADQAYKFDKREETFYNTVLGEHQRMQAELLEDLDA